MNNYRVEKLIQVKKTGFERLMEIGGCLLYTSDAADERSSVDLGGRRIIKKKNKIEKAGLHHINIQTCKITYKTTHNKINKKKKK